ncbi:MAG: histidine kinase [Bacteroidia bacterium]|nr:histidine kinase [Bacteroidia bacterium]
MRPLLILSIFLFLWEGLNAQNSYPDSLSLELKKAKTKIEKADFYFRLAVYWARKDSVEAFAMLDSAALLIDKKDDLHQGILLYYTGTVIAEKESDRKQEFYMRAEEKLKKSDTEKAYNYRARLWNSYGLLEQYKGNQDAYVDILLNKSIPYIKKTGDISKLARYYMNVGVSFYNQAQYEKSIEYYQNAIQLLEENNKENSILFSIYLRLIKTYCNQPDTEKCAQTMAKVEKWFQRVKDDIHYLSSVPFYYETKAKYHSLMDETNEAIEASNEGMKIAKHLKLDYLYAEIVDHLINILIKTGDFEGAKKLSEELINNRYISNVVDNKAVITDRLAEIEGKLGNFQSAYNLLEETILLKDSIYNRNQKMNINQLETQYNQSESEKKILTLENKTKLHQTIALSSISFALLLLAFYIYASKQKKKQAQQELISLEQKKEAEISKALMEGNEQERSRIARELHDGLGGKLTGIKINLENAIETNHDNSLQKAVSQLEETVSDIRTLSHNLMPVSLVQYGLDAALRDFVQNLQTASTKIDYYASNLAEITDRNKQLSIYRIVQELVNNAVKHADASAIFLQCTVENGLLLIAIEDNGKGFDPQTNQRNMGLNNIETRVKYLNGKINIDSSPGNGTSINIECLI